VLVFLYLLFVFYLAVHCVHSMGATFLERVPVSPV
jgi:hypothetical protein